ERPPPPPSRDVRRPPPLNLRRCLSRTGILRQPGGLCGYNQGSASLQIPQRRGTEVVVTGAPRKRVVGYPARGFASHPLRQTPHLRFGRRRFGPSSGFAPLASRSARIPPSPPTPSPSVRSSGVRAVFRLRATRFARRARHESHPLRHLPHLRFGRRRFGPSSGFAPLASLVALGTNPTLS